MLDKLVITLVAHGFKLPSQLVGISATDIDALTEHLSMRCLLSKAVQAQERTFMPTSSLLASSTTTVMQSACSFASSLHPSEQADLDANIKAGVGSVGIPDMDGNPKLKPLDVIHKLAAASARGSQVADVLDLKVRQLKDESARSSHASIASALKCWHAFAVSVLGYNAESTLPPKSADDVLRFICIFRVGKTASNYIGSVKWACVHLGVCTNWHNAEVAMTLKGAAKRSLWLHGGPARIGVYLSSDVLAKIVNVSQSLGFGQQFVAACSIFWQFLLRVQSEGIPLLAGTHSMANMQT